MDSSLMSRGRSRELVWLTCGEGLVLFWLYLREEMEWVFEHRW